MAKQITNSSGNFIDLTVKGHGFLFDKDKIKNYDKKMYKEYLRAYNKVAKKVSDEDKIELRTVAAQRFKIRKESFPNTFRTKFFNKKKDETAAFIVYNKLPYYDLHNYGGLITKKRLIPASNGESSFNRITPKRFKEQLDNLFKSGDYFWKKKGRNTLLFAILTKGTTLSHGNYKAKYKKAKGLGKKSIKNDGKTFVLVATLAPTGNYRVRINIENLLLSKNINKIQDEFNKEFKLSNIK